MLHPKTSEWEASSCSSHPHGGHRRGRCCGMDWGGQVGCGSFCTLVLLLSSLGHGGGGKENKVAANHLGKAS